MLIGAELLTGTFYLLAVGIAVALGGVAAWLGAGVPMQFAIAGVLGVVLTIVAHRWRLARATPPPQPSLDVGQAVAGARRGTPTAPRASPIAARRGTPSSRRPDVAARRDDVHRRDARLAC